MPKTAQTKKLKIGVYIDDSNLFYKQREVGWKIDYKKLLKYLSNFGDVTVAKYFMGMPAWEPAKGISKVLQSYFTKIGYTVISKPVKKIRDGSKPNGYKNKCNFDVEIASEVDTDTDALDKVYIASGDSDLAYVKTKVINKGKWIEYLAFKSGCAWEIIVSQHTFFDDIRAQIEKE
jgi:uncharacterized LabA/DUF88 family protein